jgi:plastocyanin
VKALRIFVTVASVFLVTAACGGGQAAPTPLPTSAPSPTAAPTAAPGGLQAEVGLLDPGGTGTQKDPEGKGYLFDPNEFRFKAGDTVLFVLTAETEFHTFTVDDLGIDVEVDPGETDTFTFTFDEPGEFRLICIPHEALGMVGTITVE